MGLLLKLNNGDTQLKSLKFGKDRPGGGDSGQPFIKNPIPVSSENPQIFNDFVIRGGIKAPLSAAEDTARLAKYFSSVKSPSGLLFASKQNLLSKVGIKTEASIGANYLNGALNEGFYNPLSTLAQAGLGFIGTHFNKQGLAPLIGIKSYQEAIKQNQFTGGSGANVDFIPSNNRLLALTFAITEDEPVYNFSSVRNYDLNSSNHLISYSGGPGSIIGIGNTNINFATSNYGVSLKTLRPIKDTKVKIQGTKLKPTLTELNPDYPGSRATDFLKEREDWKLPIKASEEYNIVSNNEDIPIISDNDHPTYLIKGDLSWEYNLPSKNLVNEYNNLNISYTSSEDPSITQILLRQGYKHEELGSIIKRRPFYDSQFYATDDNITVYGGGLAGLDGRYYYTSAPSSSGEYLVPENSGSKERPSLSINKIIKSKSYRTITNNRKLETYYDSDSDTRIQGLYPLRDSLIDFNITIIDPRSPVSSSSLPFTAYIDNLSDSYGAEWNAQTYMGRGEKFYKYGNFSRDINFGFTVAVESENLLTSYYDKLNELAASLAPTYTSAGYLTGNFHKVTIGNYIKNQYGVITSLSYDIMEESPWDISSGKQLPFYIRVSGIKFIPIHTFRPESWFNAKNKYINQ